MRLRAATAGAAVFVAASAAISGVTAAPAMAEYGNTAAYQVELSANISGPQGGGVWLWIELSSNGSADYSGSDCGHGGGGASPDAGTATWAPVGDDLVINGIVLSGLGFTTTVTVPAAYGHYTGTLGSFLSLPPFVPPMIGTSQLQVAP